MAEATTKAAPKRKTTARKTTARKAPAKRKAAAKPKSTVRSNMRSVENKAAAYERKVRKTARKVEREMDDAEKATAKFANRAQEAGRNAFLASLGFYGKAFDQAQDQFSVLQDRLEERRKQADKMYADLVKRGKKVEKDAKSAMDDIELPRQLDSLTDRKKLEAKLEKVKARFSELKDSVSFGAVA